MGADNVRLTLTLALAVLSAAGSSACFRLTGPEEPTPVSPPPIVSVTVEYRQPAACLQAPSSGCQDAVIFYANWLPVSRTVQLAPDPRNQVWRGVAEGVPANFPPRDEPYEVHIFDPFLRGSATAGNTANRITVGGEFLTNFKNIGQIDENALVFVDSDGHGHNAY